MRNSNSTCVSPVAGLRVVHFVLSLDVGGLERNVVNQVREGQKLGQRVTVVCLERPGELASRVEALGGRVISLGKRPGLRPSMIVRAGRVFRELRPDVVHTHQLATLLYGGAAARLLRVPVVLHTEHGRERYASRLRTRLLGRIAGMFCDRFYCLSADMGTEVHRARVIGRSKVCVIPNGVEVAKFVNASCDVAEIRESLNIPPDAPLVGTVGRLNEVKQQDVLIRAFARLLASVPDAHLLLVGDGPRLSELKALALDLGIGSRVHFAGYRPDSAPYLRSMTVFALTSRSEGMPQALLEASVTELPIVASRVGGIPEVIADGVSGILFDPGDEAALASALKTLIVDPQRARRMGGSARVRVESRFDVAKMAAAYHRDALGLMRRRNADMGQLRGCPSNALALKEAQ